VSSLASALWFTMAVSCFGVFFGLFSSEIERIEHVHATDLSVEKLSMNCKSWGFVHILTTDQQTVAKLIEILAVASF
jgi:hemerythrin